MVLRDGRLSYIELKNDRFLVENDRFRTSSGAYVLQFVGIYSEFVGIYSDIILLRLRTFGYFSMI